MGILGAKTPDARLTKQRRQSAERKHAIKVNA